MNIYKCLSLGLFFILLYPSITPSTSICKANPVWVNEPFPHLSIEEIKGGLGVNVKIINDGNIVLHNILMKVEVTGGVDIKLPISSFKNSILKPGDVWIQNIKVSGIALGINGPLPQIMITLLAPHAHVENKGIVARIIGPFVFKIEEVMNTPGAFKGYTLFSPMVSLNTYLINNSGNIVYMWNRPYKPGLSVYLLEDGNLLRTACPYPNPTFPAGGAGGRIELIDPNGTLLWYFELSNNNMCLHHDVEMLPNGNILAIAWEYKTYDEAVAAGRDPDRVSPSWGIWPDCILEIHPTGNSGGEIVWEWHMWDHLIQDKYPDKNNYGNVAEHPELIDINYPTLREGDISHINSVDYNPEFDQILLSVHEYNEVWIIDHSTTTEEAAGHTGGRYGKGGDLLYRWGNPQTYRAGTAEDQKLFGQHDAQWIEEGCPGEGNILVFNNGWKRPNGMHSTVEEFIPPVDEDGNYYCEPGSPYGPEESFWVYNGFHSGGAFFSGNIAGAQRLPNGNTIICNGQKGEFFEVTMDQKVVWKYINPFPSLVDNQVFKVRKYSSDYPGIEKILHG
ncbi:MAG TPA: arylsulfotransferase (ASST) [Thermoplasmatales archaeon]|nr:arylsulfotransferase (ASST) [Thermoplasmatales archaeon]